MYIIPLIKIVYGYHYSWLQHSHRVVLHEIEHLNVPDAIVLLCTFGHRLLEESTKGEDHLVVHDIAWTKRLDGRMLDATIRERRIISI